eukprot:7852183-Lingulodinium_polyedra.AAC.1
MGGFRVRPVLCSHGDRTLGGQKPSNTPGSAVRAGRGARPPGAAAGQRPRGDRSPCAADRTVIA